MSWCRVLAYSTAPAPPQTLPGNFGASPCTGSKPYGLIPSLCWVLMSQGTSVITGWFFPLQSTTFPSQFLRSRNTLVTFFFNIDFLSFPFRKATVQRLLCDKFLNSPSLLSLRNLRQTMEMWNERERRRDQLSPEGDLGEMVCIQQLGI